MAKVEVSQYAVINIDIEGTAYEIRVKENAKDATLRVVGPSDISIKHLKLLLDTFVVRYPLALQEEEESDS